ncbi:hypothetical protein D3C71_1487000 [compost metagenome]
MFAVLQNAQSKNVVCLIFSPSLFRNVCLVATPKFTTSLPLLVVLTTASLLIFAVMFITLCFKLFYDSVMLFQSFPRLGPDIIFKRKKGKKESRQTDHPNANTKRKNDLMGGPLGGNRSFIFSIGGKWAGWMN